MTTSRRRILQLRRRRRSRMLASGNSLFSALAVLAAPHTASRKLRIVLRPPLWVSQCFVRLVDEAEAAGRHLWTGRQPSHSSAASASDRRRGRARRSPAEAQQRDRASSPPFCPRSPPTCQGATSPPCFCTRAPRRSLSRQGPRLVCDSTSGAPPLPLRRRVSCPGRLTVPGDRSTVGGLLKPAFELRALRRSRDCMQ